MKEFGTGSLQRNEGAGKGEGEGGDVEQAQPGVFHQERGRDRHPHGRTTHDGDCIEGGGGRGGGSGGGGYPLDTVKDVRGCCQLVWTWNRVRLLNLLRITRDGVAGIQYEIEATFPEEEKEAAFQCRWRDENRAAVGS